MINNEQEERLSKLITQLKYLLKEAEEAIEESQIEPEYKPQYGDTVRTVDGKIGIISGGLGSFDFGNLWMVKIEGLNDEEQPWYVRQQLTLIVPGKESQKIMFNEDIKYNLKEPICYGLYTQGNYPKDNPKAVFHE